MRNEVMGADGNFTCITSNLRYLQHPLLGSLLISNMCRAYKLYAHIKQHSLRCSVQRVTLLLLLRLYAYAQPSLV